MTSFYYFERDRSKAKVLEKEHERLKVINESLTKIKQSVGFGPTYGEVHSREEGNASWCEYELVKHLKAALELSNIMMQDRKFHD